MKRNQTWMKLSLLVLGAVAPFASAGIYTKANNTSALNTTASWDSATVVPGASDTVVWNSTVTGANTSDYGGATSWGGIQIVNPGGTVTIGGATRYVLTLGAGGIDMSSATQNLILQNTTVAVGSTSQTWNVAAGRSLFLSATNTLQGQMTGNTGTTVTVTGGGFVDLLPSATGYGGYAGNWLVQGGSSLRSTRNQAAAFGTGTITLNNGTLAVGGVQGSGAQGNWTFNNNIVLNTAGMNYIDEQIPNNSTYNRWLKLEGNISGSGSLTFLNSGLGGIIPMNNDEYGYILSGSNSFTGGMTINSGSYVRIGGSAKGTTDANAGNNGSIAGTVAITDNGVLRLTRNDTWTFANNISGSGQLKIGGTVGTTTAQIVTLSGSNSYTGATTLVNGTLKLGSTTALSSGSALTISAGTLDVNTNSNTTGAITLTTGSITGTTGVLTGASYAVQSGTVSAILGGSGALTKSTTGTVTLSGVNTYTGLTTVSAGTLVLGHATNTLSDTGAVTVGGGTLDIGANSDTVGAVTLTSGSITGTTGVLTGASYSMQSGTVSAILGGSGTLAKSTTGTVTLSGANTYSGATTVNAGRLVLTGSLASPVTVNAGSISGTGSTTGLLTMNTGSVIGLAGGATTTSFTANGVTFAGTATVTFDTAATPNTAYDVFTYGGGTVTNIGNLTVPYRGTLSNDAVNSKYVFTTGSTATRTWNTTSGTWDFFVTPNWLEGDQKFFTGDTVIFNDPGTASTVTLVGALAPASATITNTGANTYTFSGTGYISGTGSLTKAGTGTLVLATANTYTGATTITAGTLKITGSSLAPSSAVSIASGATLEWAADVAAANAISGAGTIARTTTAGNASFSGSNSGFTGNWNITSGYVGFASDATVGASNVGLTLSGGGIYFASTGQTLAATRTVTLGTGGGTLNGATGNTDTFAAKFTGSGALTKVSGSTAVLTGTNDFTGAITISAGTLEIGGAGSLGGGAYSNTISNGTALKFSTSANQTLSGVISGAGTLTKSGTGTLTLSGNNTYTGNTTISGGVLELTSAGKLYNGAYNNTAVITVGAGGTWKMPDYSYTGVGQLADYAARRVLNGGTIEVTGGTQSSGQDFTVNVTTGGTFRYNPANTTNTLTLSGNANDNIQVNGPLTFDAIGNIAVSEIMVGTGTLTKTGAGTLTLSAANTYTGATTLSAGRLAVTGSLTSAITVNAGTISGTGSTTGLLTMAAGTNFALAGGAATTSLTANGVTFSGATTLMFDAAPVTSTVYDVLTYGSGTVTNLSNLASGYRGTLSDDTTNKKIVFTAGTVGTRTWNTTTGTWAIATGTNFVEGDQMFYNGDSVVFGNIASDSVVTLTGSLLPASVTVSNAANTYTFTGGSIDGTSTLAKSGTGTLILSNVNTYSGTTTVSGGTLRLTGTNTGAGAYTLTGGTLSVAGAANGGSTYSLNGGSLVVEAAGYVKAAAISMISIASSLTINGGGTVAASSLTANWAPVAFTVDGTLNISGALTPSWNATKSITGTGTINAGSFANNNYSVTTIAVNRLNLGGNLTLASGSVTLGGTTLGAYANWSSSAPMALTGTNTINTLDSVDGVTARTVTLSGTLSGAGRLAKDGSGTLVLSGANSYAGGTLLSAGTLKINTSSALGTGSLTVNAGVLDLNAFSPSVGSLSGAGGLVTDNSTGTAVTTLTVNQTADGTYAGVIGNGASKTLALVKSGAGNLTLSGTNTYSGSTAVNAGTLTVSGAVTTAMTVGSSGTLAISGTGAVNGDILVSSGGGLNTAGYTGVYTIGNGRTLTIGRTGTPGTDVTGNLATGTGATLELGGLNTATSLGVTGNLTLGGGTVKFDLSNVAASGNDTIAITGVLDLNSSTTLNLNLTNAVLGIGSYSLISAGSITGSLSNISVNPPGILAAVDTRQTVALSTTTVANTLTLDVTGQPAATLVWNNAAATGVWDLKTSANWNNGGVNDMFYNADYVQFADTANSTETVTVTGTLLPTTITAANTGATAFTVNGTGKLSGAGSLTVNGGGSFTLANSGNDYTGATTVSNGSTLGVGAANALSVGSALTINNGTLDLGANSTAAGAVNLVSGTISGTTGVLSATSLTASSGTISASLGGTGSVTTSGTVTLSASNSYTGGTTVTGGTLSVVNASGLGTGAVNVNGTGATLDVGAAVAGVGTVTLTNGTISGSGSLSASGYDLRNGSVNIVLGGAGALTKSTAGTVTISGANSYAGATIVNAGVLTLNVSDVIPDSSAVTVAAGATLDLHSNSETIGSLAGAGSVLLGNGTLTVGDATNTVYSGIIGGAGTGFLVKQGTGTLTLSAINTYTGDTTVNNGTLNLNSGGASGAIRGTVTVNSGATLWLGAGDALGYNNGTNVVRTINLVGGTMTSAAGGNQTTGADIYMTGGTINGTVNLDLFNSTSSITTHASATPSIISVTTMNLRQDNTAFNVEDGEAANDLVISSNIGNGSTGNHAMIKNGAGTMALTGSNVFTGDVTINNGVLDLTAGALYTSAYNNTNVITINTGATLRLNSFEYGAATSLGQLSSYAERRVINGGTVEVTGGTQSSGNDFTVSSSGGIFRYKPAVTSNTLTLAGNGNSNIVLGGALTVDAIGNITVAEEMDGAGSLNKIGSGTLTLSGANAYTGVTTVSHGTLVLAGGSAIADAGSIHMVDAADAVLQLNASETIGTLIGGGTTGGNVNLQANTLTVDNATDITYGGVMSGTGGGLTKTNTGKLTLTGVSTYTGSTVINGGTLELGSSGQLGGGNYNGSIAIANGGTLWCNSSAAQTFSGLLSGTGTLVKDQDGVLTLTNGANSYSGQIRLNWGTLSFTAGAIPAGSTVTFNGGTLQWAVGNSTIVAAPMNIINDAAAIFDPNGNAVTLGGALTGSGSLYLLDGTATGTLTLNAVNTYNGFTYAGSGTLRVGVDNAIPQTASAGSLVGVDGALDMNGHAVSANALYGTTPTAVVTSVAPATLTVGYDYGAIGDLLGDPTMCSFAGVIGGAVSLVKGGSNTQTLTGANIYTGSTTVSGGVLTVAGDGSINGTSGIAVTNATLQYASTVGLTQDVSVGAGGILAYNGTAPMTGTVTLASGATLKGSGIITTPLTIGAGAAVSPGNSPGSLTTGAETWAGGGSYVWEVNQVTGVWGSQDALQGTNFDFLHVTGVLDITADSGNKFKVDITGLTAGNVVGAVDGWSTGIPHYSWTILTADGGITGFDPAVFDLLTGNFGVANNMAGGDGWFSIAQSGNSLVLTYVPEPGTLGLLALGALALLGRRRNRK